MSRKQRGGLGRGLGALIPTAPVETDSPGDSATEVDTAAGPADSDAGAPATGTDSVTRTPDTAAPATSAPDTLAPVAGAHFSELPISAIRANAKQPRTVFDDEALAELTHSVREFGVLQPVVVRPVGPADGADGADGDDNGQQQYELVMGERRFRASQAAGKDTIPAIVRTTADEDMLRDALLENIHRAQLNPLEEAAAYQQLLEEFGVTHEELARRIGRSRPQISNTIRLMNLPVAVQRRVAAGVLSAGHARALLGLDDNELQDDLASRIVAEGLSVRATEELVALHQAGHTEKKTVRRAGPKLTVPKLGELAGNLSDVFDTRVKVDLGRTKGKITVEFASIDDLERIVAIMAPDLATRRPPE